VNTFDPSPGKKIEERLGKARRNLDLPTATSLGSGESTVRHCSTNLNRVGLEIDVSPLEPQSLAPPGTGSDQDMEKRSESRLMCGCKPEKSLQLTLFPKFDRRRLMRVTSPHPLHQFADIHRRVSLKGTLAHLQIAHTTKNRERVLYRSRTKPFIELDANKVQQCEDRRLVWRPRLQQCPAATGPHGGPTFP
jgi:hypothetical protein